MVIEFVLQLTDKIVGMIDTTVEMISEEFGSMKISVSAFVGQPLYFLSWEYAFFKVCRVDQQENLKLYLLNESSYDLELVIEKNGLQGSDKLLDNIKCSISSDQHHPLLVKGHSLIPVSFSFNPTERGPVCASFSFNILQPFKTQISATYNGQSIKLVGVCMEGYLLAGNETDKNNFEFYSNWLSHHRRIVDEYPNNMERLGLFDNLEFTRKDNRLDTVSDGRFGKEFALFKRSRPVDDSEFQFAQAGTVSQSISFNVRGNKDQYVRILSSPPFRADTLSKIISPGTPVSIPISFVTPQELAEFCFVFGFACAISTNTIDTNIYSISLCSRPHLDVFMFPKDANGLLVLDFGKLEQEGNLGNARIKQALIVNIGM